jgi:hypothetical protein
MILKINDKNYKINGYKYKYKSLQIAKKSITPVVQNWGKK